MSDSKDKPAAGGKPGEVGEPKQSGRVAFDARGNPVWEWQTETGKFGREVSTQRLKKLEAQDLTLADTQSVPTPKGLSLADSPPMPGGGFNPYDSHTSGKTATQHQPTSAAGKKNQAVKKPEAKQNVWSRLKNRFLKS